MESVLKVEFPVYSYNVYLVYTDDISFSRKERINLLGILEDPLGPYVDGLHSCNDNEPDSWVFFTSLSSIGTICHECYHAISRMFKWISAEHEEEIIAYHLTYLVDKAIVLKENK